jgi:hypothetical protein
MSFYLRWVNPAVAMAVLAICTWIYIGGYFTAPGDGESAFERGEGLLDPNEMAFSMYFFAKGLFCSSVLLMAGEFLKRYLRGRGDSAREGT